MPLQPAPSPVRASTHAHHRVFLGPLPRDTQPVNTARRRRYRSLDAALVQDDNSPRRFSFPWRRASTSLDEPDVQHSTEPFFIIGHEFQPAQSVDDHSAGSTPPVVLVNPDILSDPPSETSTERTAPPMPVSRPSLYPRTTTDRASFKTARSTAALDTPATVSKTTRSVGTPGTTRTGTTDFFSAKSSVSSLDALQGDEDPVLQDDAASNIAILSPSPFEGSPSPLEGDTSTPPPRLATRLRSALRKPSQRFPNDEPLPASASVPDPKGKKKRTVYFPADEPAPVAPRQVLERTGSAVRGTSAGVVEDATAAAATRRKKRDNPAERDVRIVDELMEEEEVYLRDRVLVAVGKNTHPHLTGYDETQARKKPSERVKAVEEYLVVYRKGWVELYKEWSTPIGRIFRKSKRLCFAIPLLTSVTTFSVFSRRDLSFALCLDTATMREELENAQARPAGGDASRRGVLDRMKQMKELQWVQDQAGGSAGKNRSLVLVFIGRERTRMLDWCWRIWNELGGQVPDQLRIQVPIFDSIIDIPRPPGSSDAATLRAFSRSRILLDVFTALRAQLPDYDDLVARERERSGGGGDGPLRLELAWETDMHLDWVPPFAEWSVENRKREWAVLAGLTMIQPQDPCELLLLPIRHDANDLKLADGMRLSEPPAIEGFLYRFSGTKGTPAKHRLFVHTQSGYLLSSSIRHAQAPLAPFPHTVDDPRVCQAYFADERVRNTHNMLYSDGLIDFRSIVRMEPPSGSSEVPFERQSQSAEGQTPGNDLLQKTLARLTRTQLIVVLDSEEVVWLEASDERVALEWFVRMRELCKYWSHRQRVDARDRMNLTREINTSIHSAGAADSELARDSLTCRIANWCPYERCNTILHCGRLYLKPSPADQFRESFCILVPGYLIECSVTANCYHRRKYRYSLAETYVFSGYLAQAQQHARLRVDEPMETRLYQDGLSSSDGVEDCSFVIWIRREEKVDTPMDSTLEGVESAELGTKSKKHAVPRLAKRPTKMIVCRARCKLERDLWVRALSIEIESHSREHTRQQNRLRYGGTVSA